MLRKYLLSREGIILTFDEIDVDAWKRHFTTGNQNKMTRTITGVPIDMTCKTIDLSFDVSLKKEGYFTACDIIKILKHLSRANLLSEDIYYSILKDCNSEFECGNSVIRHSSGDVLIFIMVSSNKLQFFPVKSAKDITLKQVHDKILNNIQYLDSNSVSIDNYWIEFNTLYSSSSVKVLICDMLSEFRNSGFIKNDEFDSVLDKVMKILLANYSKDTIDVLNKLAKSPNVDSGCVYREIAFRALDVFNEIENSTHDDLVSFQDLVVKAKNCQRDFDKSPPIVKRGFNKLNNLFE